MPPLTVAATAQRQLTRSAAHSDSFCCAFFFFLISLSLFGHTRKHHRTETHLTLLCRTHQFTPQSTATAAGTRTKQKKHLTAGCLDLSLPSRSIPFSLSLLLLLLFSFCWFFKRIAPSRPRQPNQTKDSRLLVISLSLKASVFLLDWQNPKRTRKGAGSAGWKFLGTAHAG
jgi:hypothetical protein